MHNPPSPRDPYPEVLESALHVLVTDGPLVAREVLVPIAFARTAIGGRPALPRTLQARIMQRDRFGCRYCGAKTIPNPIFDLLGRVFPDEIPFHPNWKGGATHPAVLSRCGVIDHVDPVSTGGAPKDAANLVTACWPCNSRKSDLTLERLGWRLLPVPPASDWDGLVRYYEALHEAAGRPGGGHREWMSAFSTAET